VAGGRLVRDISEIPDSQGRLRHVLDQIAEPPSDRDGVSLSIGSTDPPTWALQAERWLMTPRTVGLTTCAGLASGPHRTPAAAH
jgi:hypothetical protein